MIFGGVDPGKTGGLAFLDEHGAVLGVHQMPLLAARPGERAQYDLGTVRELLLARPQLVVTVERLQPLPPKMGGAIANFERGVARGGWEWLLFAMGISCAFVPPQTWQRTMHVGTGGTDRKARSIEAVRRLWPRVELTTGRQVRERDGMAEALLIAEWGRRQHKGGSVE